MGKRSQHCPRKAGCGICRSCSVSRLNMKDDLVFDIGMHKGEDTAFYLKKGYRVVAIEADPDLAAMCRKRFQSHIEDGSLHIIEGAIVAKDDLRKGTVKFYKNQRSIWGT